LYFQVNRTGMQDASESTVTAPVVVANENEIKSNEISAQDK
jgi:hypothetical protein